MTMQKFKALMDECASPDFQGPPFTQRAAFLLENHPFVQNIRFLALTDPNLEHIEAVIKEGAIAFALYNGVDEVTEDNVLASIENMQGFLFEDGWIRPMWKTE